MNANGIWRSRGYGWLLQIDDGGYELSHVTQKNRVVVERGSRAEFERSFDLVGWPSGQHSRPEGRPTETMSLHQAGDLTRYDFERLERLPELPTFAPGSNRDPLVNFETLWQTFDEHYAFFDLHGADWAESHRLIQPRVTAGTSEDELLEHFSELLLPLEDGHVGITAGERHVQTLKAMELRRAFQKCVHLPNARVSPRSTVDAVAPKIGEILLAPFARSRTELRQAGNGIVSWCRLQAGIGYVSVLRLFGFADTEAARHANDLPHERVAVAGFLRDDIEVLEKILDQVVNELDGCRAIVLDLRINGGGFDRAGLAIASRFADQERVAFTKKARDGGGFTTSQEILVGRHSHAAKNVGTGLPTYVLTSPLCVSAGEICVLGLRALPHVTVLGQPTAGMLSDNLNKVLPNGWTFSLSNEVYTSHDGQVFEGRGIPPAALLPLDAGRFAESLQEQLCSAVSLLTASS
jgi:carboxyl-terminal processing protease